MVVWRVALKGLVTYISHVEMVVTGIKINWSTFFSRADQRIKTSSTNKFSEILWRHDYISALSTLANQVE